MPTGSLRGWIRTNKTVRHNLDVLTENGVVEANSEDCDIVYLETIRGGEDHWETIEEIAVEVE